MGEIGLKGKLLRSVVVMVVAIFGLSSVLFVSDQWSSTLKLGISSSEDGTIGGDVEPHYVTKLLGLVWREVRLGYEHVWPVSKISFILISSKAPMPKIVEIHLIG